MPSVPFYVFLTTAVFNVAANSCEYNNNAWRKTECTRLLAEVNGKEAHQGRDQDPHATEHNLDCIRTLTEKCNGEYEVAYAKDDGQVIIEYYCYVKTWTRSPSYYTYTTEELVKSVLGPNVLIQPKKDAEYYKQYFCGYTSVCF